MQIATLASETEEFQYYTSTKPGADHPVSFPIQGLEDLLTLDEVMADLAAYSSVRLVDASHW